MSARQSTCHHTATILDALSLEALAPSVLDHAELCSNCATALARKTALATVTARARRAHEQAPDLDPAAWARIRAAIDPRGAPGRAAGGSAVGAGGMIDPRGAPGRAAGGSAVGAGAWRGWLIGLATVAAGAVAIFWATAAPDTNPGEDLHIAAPARLADPPAAPVLAKAPTPALPYAGSASPPLLVVATASGDVALDVGPGALIAAAADGEHYRLLGRHTLELAQGARLRVRALDAGGVELDLIDGLASFDVNRAPDERLFRVHAGDVLIEVRGTFWSVERRASDVVVSVERGKVAVMRDGDDEVLVEAGERVVIPPRTALGEEARGPQAEVRAEVEPPPKAQRPKHPRPERMVEVDVGHASAKAPVASAEVDHLIPPILGAVRAGRCVQALSALDHVSRAVNGRLPRSAVWLTAWCQRKLGNLESSRRLFARYGAGPWPVPVGDELPPLPH